MKTQTSAFDVRVQLKLGAELCEGLHWDAEFNVLWGVDIHGMQLWNWDLFSVAAQIWQFKQRICWVLSTKGKHQLLVGLQDGFGYCDRNSPTVIQWLHHPFVDNVALRLNDAKADATGAVWAGSLNNDDESRPEGCLYRLGPAGELSLKDTGYTVANGPAINADSSLMLHTDSGRRTIYAFDLDAQKGDLFNKRVWKVFAESEGYPDGMCFDAEGHVWVAHWGAGCVSRFRPNGELIERIKLPATNITNVCFGGANLDRLFVTTARAGLSAEQLAREPLAGSLFEITNLGVTGLPSLSYGG